MAFFSWICQQISLKTFNIWPLGACLCQYFMLRISLCTWQYQKTSKDHIYSFLCQKKPRNRPQLPIFGLDWRYLLQFSIDLDYDLAYLVRFTESQATFLGSGHLKTVKKPFLTKLSLVNPMGWQLRTQKWPSQKLPKSFKSKSE